MSDSSRFDSKVSARRKYFRAIDICVLVIFTCTAFLGLYLFRNSLMQTLDVRGLEPVGTIIIKQNVVQRRHEDRTIWDRLFVESPVYAGDLIRVADLSAASVFFEDSHLNVNENTIIRIQRLAGARGLVEVELQEGNISLSTGGDSSDLLINIMGNHVQASQGSVLNAAVSQEGMTVQVNEGSASFIENDAQGRGQTRELTEGSMIAKDSRGTDRLIPAAVVMRPRPNARYLKHDNQPPVVDFSWRRINLSNDDVLFLELSTDRAFQNDVIKIDNLSSSAQAAFDTGIWYWRIIYYFDGLAPAVLSKGEITVVDSSGPELLSPVIGSVFQYKDNSPQIRFQWAEKQEASYYILEASKTPDFLTSLLNWKITSASSIQSGISDGIWYWRVKPFFSSAYEGISEYSRIASFIIEKNDSLQAPGIVIPEPEAIAAIISELPSSGDAPEHISGRTTQNLAVVPTVSRDRVPERVPRSETYTVVSGDTLSKIAGKVYGDALQWKRIFEANNIVNQDLIFPGQVFIIP